jgi:hypothetical protein
MMRIKFVESSKDLDTTIYNDFTNDIWIDLVNTLYLHYDTSDESFQKFKEIVDVAETIGINDQVVIDALSQTIGSFRPELVRINEFIRTMIPGDVYRNVYQDTQKFHNTTGPADFDALLNLSTSDLLNELNSNPMKMEQLEELLIRYDEKHCTDSNVDSSALMQILQKVRPLFVYDLSVSSGDRHCRTKSIYRKFLYSQPNKIISVISEVDPHSLSEARRGDIISLWRACFAEYDRANRSYIDDGEEGVLGEIFDLLNALTIVVPSKDEYRGIVDRTLSRSVYKSNSAVSDIVNKFIE